MRVLLRRFASRLSRGARAEQVGSGVSGLGMAEPRWRGDQFDRGVARRQCRAWCLPTPTCRPMRGVGERRRRAGAGSRARWWRGRTRRARSGSCCRPAQPPSDRRRARHAAVAGRHRHRRRQHVLPGRRPPRGGAGARRASTIVDVGTSGGVWGLERGYCLMIGGETRRSSGSTRSSRRWRPASATSPPTPGREATTAAPSTAISIAGPPAPAIS